MDKLTCTVLLITLVMASTTFSENINEISDEENKLANYLNKIESESVISIVGDYIVLQKTHEAVEPRGFNEDLLERAVNFVTNREIKIKLPYNDARDLLEEARSKKMRKLLLPILLLLKLKAAIILPIVLSVLALVSFKGFGLSLAAILLAGSAVLKNILEHAAPKVSYEVVPTPVGHWSRAGTVESSMPVSYEYTTN